MNFKKYLTIKNIFLGLTAVMLILILNGLISVWYFPDTTWSISKDDSVLLAKNKIVTQKFSASRNNLSEIQFFFGKSRKTEGGKMTLQILDENCQNKLREASIQEMPFDSDKTYDFSFSKIPVSKDKTFCLELTFKPNSATKGQKIFLATNTMPENKFLALDGQEIQGKSLSMRPAYRNDNWWKNVQELNQRISQYKPWFLKQYYLATIAILFVILSIATVVILITI